MPGKAVNRHWRDMLVAIYAEVSTEASMKTRRRQGSDRTRLTTV